MEEVYVAQTISTPLQSVNEEPKTRSKTKWIILILTIVITVILLSCGAYFLSLQKVDEKTTQSTVQAITTKNTPTITPKPTLVPTANWNIYTSSNGRYSFKYPSDGNWKMSSSSIADVQCSVTGCPKSYNIHNFIVVKSDKSSLQQFISSLNTTNANAQPYITDYKFIKINGLDAVEILTPSQAQSDTGPTVSVFIVIDGIGYLYSYTYLDPNLNSVTKLDQLPDPNPNILSTLALNGQTSTDTNTAVDWKLYTNTTLGVTLKYPPNWFENDEQEIKKCVMFSDSSSFAPPHSHTVISLCTYSDPIPSSDNNNQITLNGYQGIRVNQTSNWGIGQKVFLSNPKGGSVEFGLLLGDASIYDLILSTFRFIQ